MVTYLNKHPPVPVITLLVVSPWVIVPFTVGRIVYRCDSRREGKKHYLLSFALAEAWCSLLPGYCANNVFVGTKLLSIMKIS